MTFSLTMSTSFAQSENQNREIQQTIKQNEKKLKTNPDDAKAISKIAISYYKLRDLQTAISYYDRLIALNKKYPGALANRGMCKLFLGDKSGACSDFRESIENRENPKLIENKTLSEYGMAECDE